MAVEVRILGKQLETLVMELDRLKTGLRVCGTLCNIIEVTHSHEEVKREEQYFWASYARTVKQQTDKQHYLFVYSPMNFDEVMLNLST
jgi:hypothetical protein